MLNEIADGVWVRQSDWVWTNSIVVGGPDGLVMVDPGIHGAELNELADDVSEISSPIVAGFSTHPHWDHLLWHPRFGDVPRYATAGGAEFAAATIDQQREGPGEDGGEDVPLDLLGLVTPLPDDGGPLPGELIVHTAHAPGHAAVLLADRRVLIAGDMLSDALIPLFDPMQDDQLDAYEDALDQIGALIDQVDFVIPGHGSIAEGPAIAERLAADRAYVEALRNGEEPDDARMKAADWLAGPHEGNLRQIGKG